MTKPALIPTHPAARSLAVLAVLVAAAALASGARSGGSSISVDPAAPTAAGGVSFTVGTGGGQRDFASVAVSCDNGYATVLTVEVPAKGAGTSQVIYPPVGSCTADLEKQMQIGKTRVLASVSFTVTP